jgi:hypothetical protein
MTTKLDKKLGAKIVAQAKQNEARSKQLRCEVYAALANERVKKGDAKGYLSMLAEIKRELNC